MSPHDELIRSQAVRGPDQQLPDGIAPPRATYWALAETGRQYLVYLRGIRDRLDLSVDPAGTYQAREFNPPLGQYSPRRIQPKHGMLAYTPPSKDDWLLVLLPAAGEDSRPASGRGGKNAETDDPSP